MTLGRNDICWCGSQKKWKKCHFPQARPQETLTSPRGTTDDYLQKYGILIKTKEQIEKIRAACHLASSILEETCKQAKVGITTQELNDYASQLHQKAHAIAAPLHYGSPPFPKSICTSINEVICHGIPGSRRLEEGDIVNVDVTCILNGYYGDCSKMVVIGQTSAERALVVDVAYNCLMRSIDLLRPGIPISAIGEVIETYATSRGCSVVHQFVGHGVGVDFHEEPQIPHNKNRRSVLLVPGMTFTIEPMINAGVSTALIDPKDQWTASTADGKASAQWEHTILITEHGHEILTTWTK